MNSYVLKNVVLMKSDLIKTLEPNELGVYMALKILYPEDYIDTVIVCPVILYNQLAKGYDLFTPEIRQEICNGIQSLSKKGIIKILDKGTHDYFNLDISKLYFDPEENFYLWLDKTDVTKIMNSEHFNNRFLALKYYSFLMDSANAGIKIPLDNGFTSGKVICVYPIKEIAKYTKIPYQVALNYNKIFQYMDMIYKYTTPTGKSCYCRFKHKNAVVKYFKSRGC